jgi:glycerol-3-phosphate dehydrogenase
MSQHIITADVVIVGAGIAGLWLHNRLSQLGYHCLLLENQKIGHAQTLSAQGIIHGGSKYALNGILSNAAQTISGMPARWKACLHGNGEIDLSSVNVFTEHQLLWSTQSLSSKMVSFFASKALQSRMQNIPKSERSGLFADEGFKGALYQLDEPVLDVGSLLKALIKPYAATILKTPDIELEWIKQDGNITAMHFGEELEIQAQQFVLTSGEGTGEMLKSLQLTRPRNGRCKCCSAKPKIRLILYRKFMLMVLAVAANRSPPLAAIRIKPAISSGTSAVILRKKVSAKILIV